MEAKKTKEIVKLINICRKMGVLELKVEGVELKLSPAALFGESKYKRKKAEATKEEPATPELTDEDILFWSSPNLDQPTEA